MTSGFATLIPTSVFVLRLAIGRWVRIDGAIQSARSGHRLEASRLRVLPRTGGRCQLGEVRKGHRGRLSCGPVLSVLALSLDPKQIFDSLSPYGEIGLMLIIFAETGLLIGFFLPGDSLLFT